MPAELPSLSPRSRVTWLDLLAVAVITLAVFTPVFRSTFSPLDDGIMINDNSKVTEMSRAHLWSHWSEPSFHIYMPLALTSWQLIAWLTHHGTHNQPDWVLPTWGFKVTSVGVHVLAAVSAVWALSVLTRSRWPAIIGGLVFALHPLTVESVAWTTGLKDEYCGLFTILTIGCYARHAERDLPSAFRDGWWYLAFAAAIMATLSKPTAMVMPVLLLAVDWTVRRCPPAKRFVSLALFLLPALGIAIVIQAVQGNTSVARVGLALRPLVAADTYAFYLHKLIWPVQLSVDYGRRPTVILATGQIWWTWVAPAAVLMGVMAARSRRWLLAAAIFVVPIAPVSGITVFDMQQYSTPTDHYVYQSLVGVGLAVALLVRQWPKFVGTASAGALAVLGVLTWHTAQGWTDQEALYQRMLQENPHSWMARDLLVYLSMGRGDLFTAKRLNDQTLKDNPKDGSAWDNRSAYELQIGQYREAANSATKAAELLTVPRLPVGRRLALLGAKLDDVAVAEKGLKYWLKIEPDNQYVLGMLDNVMAAKRAQAATRAATQATQ